MDLKPLPNNGDVSPEEFKRLFEERLGNLYSRAMSALMTLGAMHSFSVANCIHLGLQKGNVEIVVEKIEQWCELFPKAPDAITAHVDTKLFFDILYPRLFMTPHDTIDGLGPFEVVGESKTNRYLTYAPMSSEPKLWVPGS